MRSEVYSFGKNQVINKRYTWRPEYQLPFESQWSCGKKFSFLNAEKPTASKLFIAQRYSHTKNNPIVDLVTEPRFLNQKIRYCRECLEEYSYHSLLHQSVFFDTCFLHGTPLIQSNIDIYDLNTATEFEEQYDVEKIVLAYKSSDIIFNSMKVTPQTISVALVDFNLYRLGKAVPKKALKEYVQRRLLNVHSQKDSLGRTVSSMSKSELFDASNKAVQAVKDTIISYDDGIEPDIKEMYLEELLQYDRFRVDGLCPLYLRSVAYRMADSGMEAFYNQCNEVLCGRCDMSVSNTDQIKIYCKTILLFWIFGTLKPSNILKIWGCFHPDKYIANNLSLERLSRWYRTGYEMLLFKLLDDMLDRGTQNLVAEYQKGRVELSDLKLVREFQLPDVFPQYLIVEDYCNVQLLAFD